MHEYTNDAAIRPSADGLIRILMSLMIFCRSFFKQLYLAIQQFSNFHFAS